MHANKLDFSHELAFVIGDVLFTGCAHHGILNILESIQELIRLSIGGFHLLDSHLNEYYETDEQLQEIASELANRYPDVVFTQDIVRENIALRCYPEKRTEDSSISCG